MNPWYRLDCQKETTDHGKIPTFQHPNLVSFHLGRILLSLTWITVAKIVVVDNIAVIRMRYVAIFAQ